MDRFDQRFFFVARAFHARERFGGAAQIGERARRFARQLHGRFRLPVHEVDERYSTTAVASARDRDAAAAAVLLEQFFSEREPTA